MKLVDILARELDRWPQGMSETVGQGHKGYLHGYAGNGNPNCQTTKQIFTMCDDYEHEKVTRAEWQSAVDALYPKFTVAEEWNGEGLPPVGTVCEFESHGHHQGWMWCIYRGLMSCGGYIVEYHHHTSQDMTTCAPFDPALTNFRPIRTPEQIAAEEREKFISEICGLLGWDAWLECSRRDAIKLFDAGYRKFEIVES